MFFNEGQTFKEVVGSAFYVAPGGCGGGLWGCSCRNCLALWCCGVGVWSVWGGQVLAAGRRRARGVM